MKSGIYSLTNIATGQRYIGRTIDLAKRKQTHLWALMNNRHHNTHLQRAWNKGAKFVFEVLEECEPDKCNEREVFWIERFDSLKHGYNQCEGGQTTTGYHFTDEQKEKISKANKGRKRSEEAIRKSRVTLSEHLKSDPEFYKALKEKRSKASRGRAPWNKGRPHTEEEKKNLSEKLKGREVSQKRKEKLRELYSGEKSLTAKLKKSDVVDIRYRFLSGERQIDIAKDYPVSPQTIYDIVRNRRWNSVPNTLEELEAMI